MRDKVVFGIRAIIYFIIMSVAVASAYSTPNWVGVEAGVVVIAIMVAAMEVPDRCNYSRDLPYAENIAVRMANEHIRKHG